MLDVARVRERTEAPRRGCRDMDADRERDLCYARAYSAHVRALRARLAACVRPRRGSPMWRCLASRAARAKERERRCLGFGHLRSWRERCAVRYGGGGGAAKARCHQAWDMAVLSFHLRSDTVVRADRMHTASLCNAFEVARSRGRGRGRPSVRARATPARDRALPRSAPRSLRRAHGRARDEIREARMRERTHLRTTSRRNVLCRMKQQQQ